MGLKVTAPNKAELRKEIRDIVEVWYEARKETATKKQFEQELEEYIRSREQALIARVRERGPYAAFEHCKCDLTTCPKNIAYSTQEYINGEWRKVLDDIEEEVKNGNN